MLDEKLIQEAEKNNVNAIFELALAYSDGKAIPPNPEKAFSLLQKALTLEAKNISVLLKSGEWYRIGFGVEEDIKKATKCFEQVLAIAPENEDALFGIAEIYEFSSEPEKQKLSEKIYVQLASSGCGKAMDRIGQNLWEKDVEEAMIWLKKACAYGYFESALTLGQNFFNGWRVAKDLDRAQYWVKKYLELASKDNDSYKYAQSFLKEIQQAKETPRKTKGCYVATAVYGSYDCPEVWTLRRYRDFTLAKTWYGRLFIKIYYAISPTLVKWFGKTNWFKNIWKPKLDRMVKKLNSNGVDNTPYEDKIY